MTASQEPRVIDLSKISNSLEQTPDGLWRAKSSSSISYPDWGNQACFQVEDLSFWFRHRNACIIEAVKQYPPSGPVFDIGGGNGFVAKGMKDVGFEVVLVEPGATGAKNAQSRGIRSVICTTLEDAGFFPGSLPAIGLFDVVEHMQNDQEFLTMVRGQLSPGGRVYITVPAHSALWSQEDIDAGHQRRYSRRALRDLLWTSGFSVDFLTGFFQFLAPAIFAARVLPYRLGVAKSADPSEVGSQMKKEHVLKNGVANEILGWLERRELARIQTRKQTHYGASWLAVATNT
jgi:SAM-dependent methyltransferase